VSDCVVIGLGNTLVSDEGIGCFLVEALSQRADEFPGVDFEELGAAGMRVLHAIAGQRKAVIVDCAIMGTEPGTIRRFTPDDVRTIKSMPGFSLHEGDILRVIDLSRVLGEAPEEIVIFGIEPALLEDCEGLSPLLTDRFEAYIAEIAMELR